MAQKTYPITFWYGIRPQFLSRERLIEARDAGFNLIECVYHDRDTNLKVLAWCDELGLKANVMDARIDRALAGEEGWEALLDEMLADYAPFASLNRFFIRDEPVDEYFPTMGRVVDYINAHDPHHGEYINLLPYHALAPAEGEDFNARYQRHIDGFFDTVHPTILSYDHYCLKFEEVESLEGRTEARLSKENCERNNRSGKLYAAFDDFYYYNNLEMIRDNARKHDVPWMSIILTTEHWHYRWPTEAEVRWEAFTALTYGSTALSYFTYWTPGSDHTEPWSYHNGIILVDGSRGEKYDIVKRINAELQTLYGGLMQALPGETTPPAEMISEAVYHLGTDGKNHLVTPFTGYNKLRAIKGENPRLVVGCFAGNRVMLTNKDYTAPMTVTLVADGTLYHLNKATGAWETCEATVTLAPGDGELYAIV